MKNGFGFGLVSDIFSEFEDMLNGRVGCYTMTTAGSGAVPWDCYINEKTKELTFCFALAGVKQENVDLEFENDLLVLKVTGLAVKDTEEIRYLKHGIKRSSFTEKFFIPLSKYDQTACKASFKDGILMVVIPAAATAQGKKVHIVV